MPINANRPDRSDRVLAPHVRTTLAKAAQPKLGPPRPPAAFHVQTALGKTVQPKLGAAERPSTASHVRTALVAAAQPRLGPPGRLPVPPPLAKSAQPRMAPARWPASAAGATPRAARVVQAAGLLEVKWWGELKRGEKQASTVSSGADALITKQISDCTAVVVVGNSGALLAHFAPAELEDSNHKQLTDLDKIGTVQSVWIVRGVSIEENVSSFSGEKNRFVAWAQRLTNNVHVVQGSWVKVTHSGAVTHGNPQNQPSETSPSRGSSTRNCCTIL